MHLSLGRRGSNGNVGRTCDFVILRKGRTFVSRDLSLVYITDQKCIKPMSQTRFRFCYELMEPSPIE